MDRLAECMILLLWIAGVVIAPGLWKILAIFFPPFALYLIVEKVMEIAGLLL